MPDAYGNPYPGDTDRKRRYRKTLMLIALFGAVLAAATARLTGGVETLVGGLLVFVVTLVVLRILIGGFGRYVLLYSLFELLVYAVLAAIFDGLFNRFSNLIALFSILTGP